MRERRGLLRLIFGSGRGDHDHELLHAIHEKVKFIMATQAEVAAELRRILAQNEKARAENQKALQALRDAIANAGASTPEVDQALADLAASIQSEDDENPDDVTPPV